MLFTSDDPLLFIFRMSKQGKDRIRRSFGFVTFMSYVEVIKTLFS